MSIGHDGLVITALKRVSLKKNGCAEWILVGD
jgi:hypothetical protein